MVMRACYKCGTQYDPRITTQCPECGRVFVRPGPGPNPLAALLLGVLAIVALMASLFFHTAHVRLGMDEVGNWIYWVAGTGIVAGIVFRIRNRKGLAILTGIPSIILLLGAYVDANWAHDNLFPLPPGAERVWAHGETEIRSGPGREYPVSFRLAPGGRAFAGPADPNGWSAVYTEDTHEPYGYVYRAGDGLRSYSP